MTIYLVFVVILSYDFLLSMLNEMDWCNQEGVAIEIAEAVVGALKGELAATAVNAPMVPAEVLFCLYLFYSCLYLLITVSSRKICALTNCYQSGNF